MDNSLCNRGFCCLVVWLVSPGLQYQCESESVEEEKRDDVNRSEAQRRKRKKHRYFFFSCALSSQIPPPSLPPSLYLPSFFPLSPRKFPQGERERKRRGKYSGACNISFFFLFLLTSHFVGARLLPRPLVEAEVAGCRRACISCGKKKYIHLQKAGIHFETWTVSSGRLVFNDNSMSLVSSAIQGWPPLPKSLSGLIKFNREATSKESAGVKKGKATLERQQRHPSKASGGSGGGFFFSPRPMSLQQQQQVSTQEHLQRQQRERQEREAKARRTSMAEKQKQLAMELKAARVDQPPRSCQARTASQIKSLSLDGTARSSKGTRSFATLRPPQPRIIDGLAVAKDGRRPVR